MNGLLLTPRRQACIPRPENTPEADISLIAENNEYPNNRVRQFIASDKE
jgi:hypothetical protein